MYDSTIGARFPNPRIEQQFGRDTMPETAQNVAAELGISREQADAYAAQSQRRYEAARADGFFAAELQAVEVPQGRKKPPLSVTEDEHPRPGTDVEKLAKLPAIVEGGVITAGNASGVNDGAGALIIGSRAAGEKAGIARARASSPAAWPACRRASWAWARWAPAAKCWTAPASPWPTWT